MTNFIVIFFIISTIFTTQAQTQKLSKYGVAEKDLKTVEVIKLNLQFTEETLLRLQTKLNDNVCQKAPEISKCYLELNKLYSLLQKYSPTFESMILLKNLNKTLKENYKTAFGLLEKMEKKNNDEPYKAELNKLIDAKLVQLKTFL